MPTVTFQRLFCFVVMSLDRRRILHVNVTKHPTVEWTAQQLIEAFPAVVGSLGSFNGIGMACSVGHSGAR